MKCKRLPLAIAVASAMGAGVASADEGNRGDYEKSNIHIDKDVDVTHELHHKGKIYTAGVVLVDSTATALSEVEQKVKENTLSEQQMFIEPNSENPVVMFGGSVDDQNSGVCRGHEVCQQKDNDDNREDPCQAVIQKNRQCRKQLV